MPKVLKARRAPRIRSSPFESGSTGGLSDNGSTEQIHYSRSKRKRLAARERREAKAALVEVLETRGKEAANVKQHGKALADMRAITAAIEEEAEKMDVMKEEKRFQQLRSALHLNNLNKKQTAYDEQRGLLELEERLRDPAFLSDPLGFTLAKLNKIGQERAVKVSEYRTLRGNRSNASGVTGKTAKSGISMKSRMRN